jgi:hypothetical protein
MLFFRSEDHLAKWLNQRAAVQGTALSLATTWRLAKAWYVDRREPDWRPRSVAQAQAVLGGVGLTAPFWKLRRG